MSIAIIVGCTGMFAGVAVGADTAVSRGAGSEGTSTSASSGVAVLVGRNGSLRCISVMAVAEGVGVGGGSVVSAAHGLTTIAVAVTLIGAVSHGLLTVAVICWPAAITTSSLAVITWAVPAAVSR